MRSGKSWRLDGGGQPDVVRRFHLPRQVKHLALVVVVVGNCLAAAQSGGAELQLKQTIPLPGVEGRIDHLDLDPANERLFVCALGNNTAEVLDLRKANHLHPTTTLPSPPCLPYTPNLT